RLAQAAMAVVPDSTVIIPILHNDSDYVYSIGCANQSAWNVAVAVSERVLQTAKLRVADKPVVLIHHGVDIPSELPHTRVSNYESPMRLVFAGRLDHCQKGVLLLPEILAGCIRGGFNVKLSVIGDGPDRGKMLQLAKQLGVSESI